LHLKAKEGRLLFVDDIASIDKTKVAGEFLKKTTEGKKVTVMLSDENKGAYLYFRNIKDIVVQPYRNLNAYIVVQSDFLLIDSVVLNAKNVSKEEKPNKKKEVKSTKSTSKPKSVAKKAPVKTKTKKK